MVCAFLTNAWMLSVQRFYKSPNSGLNKARTQILNKKRMIAQVI